MARQSLESHAFAEEEKPLDPAVQRVQTRLRRLMLIAGLTLGLGIFAVFAAILYRIASMDTTAARQIDPAAPVPALSQSLLGLPAGAKLVSTALDGGRLALTYDTGEGTETVVVDAGTGAVLSRLKVGP